MSKEVYLHLGRQLVSKSHPCYSCSTSVVFSTSALERSWRSNGYAKVVKRSCVKRGLCRVRAEVESPPFESATSYSLWSWSADETSRISRICEVQEINTDLRLRQFEEQVVRQVLAAKAENRVNLGLIECS